MTLQSIRFYEGWFISRNDCWQKCKLFFLTLSALFSLLIGSMYNNDFNFLPLFCISLCSINCYILFLLSLNLLSPACFILILPRLSDAEQCCFSYHCINLIVKHLRYLNCPAMLLQKHCLQPVTTHSMCLLIMCKVFFGLCALMHLPQQYPLLSYQNPILESTVEVWKRDGGLSCMLISQVFLSCIHPGNDVFQTFTGLWFNICFPFLFIFYFYIYVVRTTQV